MYVDPCRGLCFMVLRPMIYDYPMSLTSTLTCQLLCLTMNIISFSFKESLLAHFPRCTISFGWAEGSCRSVLTSHAIMAMWPLCQTTRQPVTITVRACFLKTSWADFRNLLQKAPDRLTITMWSDVHGANETSVFDLLYVRNDIGMESLFYDLPRMQMQRFRQLSVRAGSLLHYFQVQSGDGAYVTWSRDVNSPSNLTSALDNGKCM